jgi:glycosyltransferase involved in cell wall biosynthesis
VRVPSVIESQMNVAEKRKPRLVVLASTYPRWPEDHEPGFVHELARRLTKLFDVVAVVPGSPGTTSREFMDDVDVLRYRYAPSRWQTLVNDGGMVSNLRRSPWKWLLVPGFVFMQWWEAYRLVRNRRDVVVHAHWLVPQGVVASMLPSPYLLTSHGGDLYTFNGRLAMWFKRYVVRQATSLVVVSSAMRELAERLGTGATQALVGPMGVDLEGLFTPDTTVLRKPQDLLFVGRLVEKKGVSTLLEAFASASVGFPLARLNIVGHGPEEELLKALSVTLGIDSRVSFTGGLPQKKLVRWYREATALIAPFREAASGDQEGLGLVLVEALGCGCPVVASDLPATRDVLADFDGVIRVSPGDSANLAEALKDVLASPGIYADAVLGTRELLVDRFDWTAVAGRYGEWLMDCLSIPGQQGRQ